nr:MBL fold metallo-hydrolase [Flavobacterium sp.]
QIVEIEGLSAHGDQEDLIQWLSQLSAKPEKIFLMHGEANALLGLKNKIEEVYVISCEIPYLEQMVEIN